MMIQMNLNKFYFILFMIKYIDKLFSVYLHKQVTLYDCGIVQHPL